MKKITFLISSLFFLSIGICKAQYTVLYDFSFGGTNGSSPHGDLAYQKGLLYGMGQIGGTSQDGVIFSIDTNGHGYRDLYNFNGPYGIIGSLTLSGHTMYGMTSEGGGGVGVYCPSGCGCVFSIDTDGTRFKQVLTFNGTNGGYVWGNLTLLGSRLFGMSLSGGANNAGCAFSVDTDGTGYKDILDFNHTNGAAPEGSFILIGNVLYGMATAGGLYDSGCIFSIDTSGSNYRDLHDFHGVAGAYPGGSLIYNSGKFYGMTVEGGTRDSGVVFSIDTNGSGYKKLFDFNSTVGTFPRGTLALSGKLLYGLTLLGGVHDSGCMFSIDTDGTGFKKLVDFAGAKGTNPWGSPTVLGNLVYGMTSSGGTMSNGGVIFSFNNVLTGVNEVSNDGGKVNLYPNPNNGNFTVTCHSEQSEESTIEVYNELGQQVYSNNYQITKSSNYQIDLSSQPNGIYLYRVITNSGELMGEGKLVIEK